MKEDKHHAPYSAASFSQKPNIGSELTGGCYGFATRYNHWPEGLIVGGTTKNMTGHIQR